MLKRYRTEIKYLCGEQTRIRIQERLRQVLQPDRHGGPDARYSVHSLYFDDLTDSCAADNEAGANVRAKYRIRCYGDRRDALHLERKEKVYGRTRKLSCPLTQREFELLTEGRGAELFWQAEDPLLQRFCAEIMKRGFAPKLVLSYERTAYVEPALNVRVTFDSLVQASACGYGFPVNAGTPAFPLLSGTGCIMEIKYDDVFPGWLTRLLPLERLTQSTFSKYYLGRKKLEEVYR